MGRAVRKSQRLQMRQVLVRRVHTKHHCKRLARPRSRKDITTPTTPLRTAVDRMRQRLCRQKTGVSLKFSTLPWNNGMRVALQVNGGKRPPDVSPADWAKVACPVAKIPEQSHADVSWMALRKRVTILSLAWCSKCGASDSRACYCGAALIASSKSKVIANFLQY